MIKNHDSHGISLRIVPKFVACFALMASVLTVGLEGVSGAVISASTVVAVPTSVAADGVTTSTITVTLASPAGATDTVSLAGTAANSSVINGGAAGALASEAAVGSVATFTVKDATNQSVTYQAIDVTSGPTTIVQEPTVVFTPYVIFNGNNSTSGSMSNQTAAVATALTTNAYARTGYSFIGWNTAANGSGTPYLNGASYPFTADATLYAQWSEITEASTFPTSADTTGETTLAINPQHIGDLIIFESEIHSQTITVSSVAAPGTGTWQLADRYVDPTNHVITEEIWWSVATATGATTITATYSASVAGIISELTADSYTTASASTWSAQAETAVGTAATAGTTITYPDVTSAAAANQLYWGYAESSAGPVTNGTTPGFSWYTTIDGNLVTDNPALSASTAYTPTATTGSSTTTTDAEIFSAVPTAASFTVTFMGNGSTSGSMSNETDNTATALTANAFVRTGYTFAGWNTVAGGGGTAYANSASYPFTANVTLYAQWTLNGGGGGGGGGGGTPATLSISVANITVTAGGSIAPVAAVTSGLVSPDTATLAGATITFAGTGSTVYAASTTAPTAVGTYSMTPAGGTVTISPSADASKYSTTYSYFPGTLTINAAVVVTPPPVPTPHASRVVGTALVGRTRTLTIVGSAFTATPSVTSNQAGAIVRVHARSANRIVVTVTVRLGVRPGAHLFTITTSAGKKCRIGYITR
jgi:uncharacterized repeat protein (TIGR02543 family)